MRIRSNGHFFGYIVVHCKQATINARKNLIYLTFFRTMDFEKETFLLNAGLLLTIDLILMTANYRCI